MMKFLYVKGILSVEVMIVTYSLIGLLFLISAASVGINVNHVLDGVC